MLVQHLNPYTKDLLQNADTVWLPNRNLSCPCSIGSTTFHIRSNRTDTFRILERIESNSESMRLTSDKHSLNSVQCCIKCCEFAILVLNLLSGSECFVKEAKEIYFAKMYMTGNSINIYFAKMYMTGNSIQVYVPKNHTKSTSL